MTPKLQLPAPKLGLSDDRSTAEQPPQTTRRAKNVRLIDPRTGRSRLARRAGWRKFFSAVLPTNVSHIAALAYNAPKIEYTQRTGDEIAADWSTDLDGGIGRAVRVDARGSVYVLLLDGTVRVYNPDGRLIDTIQVPLIEGENVNTNGAFAVDEASRVYVASTKASNVATTRIFQWRRVADPNDETLVFYDRAWTLELENWVGDIIARAGAFWITRTEGNVSSVAKYGGATLDEPIFEWSKTVPFPCNDIAVGPTGDVYFSSPSNSNRGAAPGFGGLHAPNLRFTAHDIGWTGSTTENATFSDDTRLHAWVDATRTVQTTQGAAVTEVYDRRYILTQNTEPHPTDEGVLPGDANNPEEYDDGPADNTPRHLSTFATDGGRRGPTLDLGGWAGGPALVFDPDDAQEPNNASYRGSGIRSPVNTSPHFKGDTTGPQNLGSDTDGTDESVTVSWTPWDGMSVGPIGSATNNGVVQVQVRFTVQVGTPGPGVLHFRALRETGGTTVYGPQVTLELTGNTVQTRSVTLPISPGSNYQGTYTIETRKDAVLPSIVLQGTVTPSEMTVEYNDGLPDSDGLNAAQQALIPGNQPTGGYGDNWTALSAWRVSASSGGEMRLMACQGGVNHKWALLAHTAIIGGTLGHRQGYLTFISNRIDSGSTTPCQFPGNPPEFQGWRGVSFQLDTAGPGTDATVLSGSNTDLWALITIQFTETTAGDSGASAKSFWRVNGRAAGTFRVTHMEAWGAGSHVMIGNKHWATTPQPDDLFPESMPFAPFAGLFHSWVTVYGSTTTEANGDPTTYPSTAGVPPDSGTRSGTLDVTLYDTDPPNLGTSYTITATEVERLEGGLAHAIGLSNFLPNGLDDTGGPVGGFYLNHPFGGSAFPPTGFASDAPVDELAQVLLSPRPILGKIGPTGSEIVWALNGSGLGNSVVAQAGSRHIVATGEKDQLDIGFENTVLRRVFDGGNTYSLDATDGAWTYDEAGYNVVTQRPQLVLDDADQVYWARSNGDTLVKHRGSDGTRLWTYTNAQGNTRQVALPPDRPIYPTATDDEDESPTHVYLSGNTLDKLRIVTETQVIGDNASPRQHRYLAVAGRTLWQGTSGGAAAIVSGGTAIFAPTRTYIASATLFQRHYFTDGQVYVVYDPVANTAEELTTTVRGELPKRGRLLASWQGRLVVARTQDDESTLFASRFGDGTDWDYHPLVPTVEDAWNSTLGVGPGSPPDMITALIELDDILIVGCDHSIYKLVGDPRAGGRIELVSDQTGVAFGSAWCKDPEGRVYFFGQRGGIWRITRGLDSLVSAERISRYTVERRLQSVDLTERRVELRWDYQEEGMRVFFVPYS